MRPEEGDPGRVRKTKERDTMRRCLTWIAVLVMAAPAVAQDQPDLFQPFGNLGDSPDTVAATPKIATSLHPATAKPGERVTLTIEVIVPEGYYTYSIGDDPNSTIIKISEHAGLETLDKTPRPDHPPKIEVTKIGKTDFRQEKHIGRVVWRQAFKRSGGEVAVGGTITLSMCNATGCLPPETYPIEVALGEGPKFPGEGTDDSHPLVLDTTPTTKSGGRELPSPVSWHIELSPAGAKPGEIVTLSLSATLDDGFHIFSLSQDTDNGGVPTRIFLQGLRGLEAVDETFQEDRPFEVHVTKIGNKELEQKYFHGTVTWSRKYRVSESASPGGFGAKGRVIYQYCNEKGCLKGRVAFALGQVSDKDKVEKSLSTSTDGVQGLDLEKLEVQGAAGEQSLGVILLIAFGAGFILNFMPCVLPVIGLKVMSFVEQAGENRKQTFMLNFWFSLGLISVYMVLATLAKTIGLGWGAQFGNLTFNIVLVSVVFAFALSFLDIWEIPIPGFTSTTGPGEVEQEGAVGAFSKGALTTVLATPCSGPMLVPALTYAASQPFLITYLGFFMVGLGMAFPYLMIGAFPGLIGFLPKPGMWMETFKHVMGFVLLGTVVWLMTIVAAVSIESIVPLVGFLFAIWSACWWFGKVPLTAGRGAQVKAMVQGTVFAAAIGWVMFSDAALGGIMHERFDQFINNQVSRRNEQLANQTQQNSDSEHTLNWERFTPERLADLTTQQKTVFVDFTADW